MNFRDAYKSMTDQIRPDKELLDKVLEPAFKKKKHFVLPVKSVYAATLAAMFVIAAGTVYFKSGIIDYLPAGEKTTKRQTYETQIHHFAQSGESREGDVSGEIQTKKDIYKSDSADSFVSDEEKAFNDAAIQRRTGDSNDSASHVSDDRDSCASLRKETAENEAFAKNENTQTSNAASDSDSKTLTEDAYDESVNSQESGLSPSISSGGGGGGAPSGAGEVSTQNMSISQYWQYIGFDVSSRISLPHNMTFHIPQTATVKRQGDEVIQDILSISATSPDGEYSLFLTMSKTVAQSGTVSVMVDGVYIGICSDTLSEEEISGVLSSIR